MIHLFCYFAVIKLQVKNFSLSRSMSPATFDLKFNIEVNDCCDMLIGWLVRQTGFQQCKVVSLYKWPQHYHDYHHLHCLALSLSRAHSFSPRFSGILNAQVELLLSSSEERLKCWSERIVWRVFFGFLLLFVKEVASLVRSVCVPRACSLGDVLKIKLSQMMHRGKMSAFSRWN